jgi:hypothetical protein
MGMGEFKIWVDEGMRIGRGTPLAGEARVAEDGACCKLSLKIADAVLEKRRFSVRRPKKTVVLLASCSVL